MKFTYTRTIRFGDTDAAGVVYFANVLNICHEAYEEALIKYNCELRTFFRNDSTAIPIIHAEVDFFHPMYCGDRLFVNLTSELINDKTFLIQYEIVKDSSQYAQAQTKHICINPLTRKTKSLSQDVLKWIKAE